MDKSVPELPAEVADLLSLGAVLGQNQSFALVAGRCSAAQAAGLRRLREERLYKVVAPQWRDFCANYLKMSRTQADQIIHLLEEFGPGYFEVAQLTRVSPETYRAIAPAVKDGVLQHQGNSIELSVENSRKVAAAVAEIRRARPAPKRPVEMHVRIRELDKRCTVMLDEFNEIARLERYGENFLAFTSVLSRMIEGFRRLGLECGVV
ncbi:MAG TPA: hypothetical protein VGF16_07955 [Bryobacteraceae bacterium]